MAKLDRHMPIAWALKPWWIMHCDTDEETEDSVKTYAIYTPEYLDEEEREAGDA